MLNKLRLLMLFLRELAPHNIWRAVLYLLFYLPFYPFGYKRARQSFKPSPPPLFFYASDSSKGLALLKGQYNFAGETQRDHKNRWNPVDASIVWKRTMHGFAWVNDINALRHESRFDSARFLILDWVKQNPHWSLPAWHSPVLAERLYSWLYFYPTLIAPLPAGMRKIIHLSISSQFRHLRRGYRAETRLGERLMVMARLCAISLSLNGHSSPTPSLINKLSREIERQINSDGGHIERNPEKQARILARLVELKIFCHEKDFMLPLPLLSAIDRMVLFLKMMCHGEGGCAVFNGGDESSSDLIKEIIAKVNLKARLPDRADKTGFSRLSAGASLAIIDTGSYPLDFNRDEMHAGLASFEFSIGPERIIVNCGKRAGHVNKGWLTACRTSAAHSTVVIDNKNSSDLSRWGKRCATGQITRDIDGSGITISHDGYMLPYQINCLRELRLRADGHMLYGRDRLIGQSRKPFAIRFHIHPFVTVSLLRTGQDALLKTEKNKTIRFHSQGAKLTMEASIYCGTTPSPLHSHQLVLSGNMMRAETIIEWRFHHEA